jgi:hypothetical protein
MTRPRILAAALAAGLLLASVTPAPAAPIQSFTPVVTGGTLIDFEGFAEGTLIDTQFPGVTFAHFGGSLYPSAGRPQIDNNPALFGYGFSSGSAALTGSTEGGAPFPTVQGIRMTFGAPASAVQAFFSDTSPLGSYLIQALGAGDVVLESFTLGPAVSAFLPPGYAGGIFPPPGTTPLPGVYVGFSRPTADILAFVIGPSSVSGDAFGIDDVRFEVAGTPGLVPEPGSFALLGAGLLALAGYGWRRRAA